MNNPDASSLSLLERKTYSQINTAQDGIGGWKAELPWSPKCTAGSFLTHLFSPAAILQPGSNNVGEDTVLYVISVVRLPRCITTMDSNSYFKSHVYKPASLHALEKFNRSLTPRKRDVDFILS